MPVRAHNRWVVDGECFADVKPRRPLWQLMLGGVFDRRPDLRFVLTEVRADWIPALLRQLDAVTTSADSLGHVLPTSTSSPPDRWPTSPKSCSTCASTTSGGHSTPMISSGVGSDST